MTAKDATGQARYRLASHVYACRSEQHIVFLDVIRDRYFGVLAANCDEFCEAIADLPTRHPYDGESRVTCASTPPSGVATPRETLDLLITNGLISDDSARGKMLGQDPPHVPRIALLDEFRGPPRVHRRGDIAKFLLGAANAWALRRLVPLHWTLHRISRRNRANAHATFSMKRAIECLSSFYRLRPLLYTERDACLYNSLVVSEYLARQKLFPRLVFGVTTTPFKAHCWLQHEDVVINDMPGNVRGYTPILVV